MNDYWQPKTCSDNQLNNVEPSEKAERGDMKGLITMTDTGTCDVPGSHDGTCIRKHGYMGAAGNCCT